MTDVLPSASEEPGLPVSGAAVLGGVLAAYGAFAVLISIVAAFANGAHSHQVLSGATWKQLGTGGGIVAAIALFLAWAAGGFVAARMAGRDGLRHGLWVFIVGIVSITVVGAAITWLPDTTAILRNLRLLGLPVRRNEWRDVGTVAGIASLIGTAVGAASGGWFALRERAPAPAPHVAAPAAPPPPPEPAKKEPEPEPAFVGPSLFEETGFEPDRDEEPSAPPSEREPEPVAEHTPAWLQFVQERERAIQREREVNAEATPAPAPARREPAPWTTDEPAPAFLEEERPEPEPAEATSWWPEGGAPVEPPPEPAVAAPAPSPSPVPGFDDAWALPDDEEAHPTGAGTERAFPASPPTPVPEPSPASGTDTVVVPPLGEHADWNDDDELYRAPPEATGDQNFQHAPAAPPPAPELDLEEREERRRQQEEAARAYEQARDEQARDEQ